MPDDKTQRGATDRTRTNVHEDDELRGSAERFNISPEKLKDAV